jgi:flagellin
MERLASGKRINGAKDDAAGLTIATRMQAQTRGYDQAIRNTNDGMSLLQTAEGALGEVTNILQRMRELSVQAANETYNVEDITSVQEEVDQLTLELSRIAAATSFNGLNIFSQMKTKFSIQAGDKANQDIDLRLSSVRPETLARQARAYSQGGVLGETSLLGDNFGDGNGGDAFIINGVNIRDSITEDDQVSTIYNHGSAIAKARVINGYTEETNVKALVGETRTDNHEFRNSLFGLGFDPFGNTSAVQGVELTSNTYITINDIKISGFSIEENDATGSLVDSINAYAEETGVIAHLSAQSELVLVAKDGRNIQITYNDGGFGLAEGRALQDLIGLRDGEGGAFVYAGSVSLQSEEVIEADFGFAVSDNLGGIFEDHNFFGGVQNAVFGVNSDYAVDKIHITNKASADEAINTIDLALEEVSAMRGDIGALHNRLEHTVNNLSQTSENTKIAKSRIEDAEYAYETAEMTKAMMITSANMSVLAQANQSTSIALQLLGSVTGSSLGGSRGGPASIF